ncbi:hypothetical protein SAMN05216274_11534 [Cryobacterium levicorallinum]|nr:hypothetical protein SAMN05216274_11534 [Cryobacterium levicorallinum]
MPGRSHVVFSAFSTLADPRLQGWATLRGQINAGSPSMTPISRPVAARTLPDVAAVQAGLWRLLAPNNRELGRSASVYSSLGSARAHVLRLQGLVAEMRAASVIGPASGTYGFCIFLDETVVMTNGRWFAAAAASLEAAAATIEALGGAMVIADAPVPQNSGAHEQPEATKILSW